VDLEFVQKRMGLEHLLALKFDDMFFLPFSASQGH
jgi:hypothetical protein